MRTTRPLAHSACACVLLASCQSYDPDANQNEPDRSNNQLAAKDLAAHNTSTIPDGQRNVLDWHRSDKEGRQGQPEIASFIVEIVSSRGFVKDATLAVSDDEGTREVHVPGGGVFKVEDPAYPATLFVSAPGFISRQVVRHRPRDRVRIRLMPAAVVTIRIARNGALADENFRVDAQLEQVGGATFFRHRGTGGVATLDFLPPGSYTFVLRVGDRTSQESFVLWAEQSLDIVVEISGLDPSWHVPR